MLEGKHKELSAIENILSKTDKEVVYLEKEQQYYVEFYKNHVKENPREALHKKQIKEAKIKLAKAKKVLPTIQKEVSDLEARRDKSLKENTKETVCGSQGDFSFTGLKPGDYFIRTTVQWKAGDEKQGGTVNKVITLKEGDNRVIISE